MRNGGVQPNFVTFVGVLKACASIVVIEESRCVHEQIIESGLDSNVIVGSSLINMYIKCENIEDAWGLFKKMPSRDEVICNYMILGHVKGMQEQKALELF
jgi:pentatricopeptide repeat protein